MSEATSFRQDLEGHAPSGQATAGAGFNLREALSIVCRQAHDVFGWRVGLLLLSDEMSRTCQLVAAAGLEPSVEIFLMGAGVGATDDIFGALVDDVRIGSSFVFDRLGEGTPFSLREISDDAFDTHEAKGPAVIVPLRVRRKRMGVLAVYDIGGEHEVEQTRLKVIEALATNASLLVEQAVSSELVPAISEPEERADSHRDLESLTLAIQELANASGVDTAISLTTSIVESVLPTHASALFLLDATTGDARLALARGADASMDTSEAVALGRELVAEVIAGRRTLQIDPQYDGALYRAMRRSSRSALAVSLRAGGEGVGILVLESDRARAFGAREAAIATSLATAAAASIARALNAERTVAERRERMIDTEPSSGLRERFEAAADAVRTSAVEEADSLLRLRTEYRSTNPEILAFVDRRVQAIDTIFSATALRPIRVYEPLELNRLVQRAIDETRERLTSTTKGRRGGIDLRFEPCRSARASGSADELREAVLALIDNAVDAQPDGGTIAIRTVDRAGVVGVRVRDHGVGMTERVRARSCEPFFTTKSGGNAGLGLSIAFAVAIRHGGRLILGGAAGEGTSVTIALPAYDGSADTTEETSTRRSVLVVASDTLAYLALSGAIEWAGLRPVRALDTSEVLRAVDSSLRVALVVDALSFVEHGDRLNAVCRALPEGVRCVVVHLDAPGDAVRNSLEGVSATVVHATDLDRVLGEL